MHQNEHYCIRTMKVGSGVKCQSGILVTLPKYERWRFLRGDKRHFKLSYSKKIAAVAIYLGG